MRLYQADFKLDREWINRNFETKNEPPQTRGLAQQNIKNELHGQTELYNADREDVFFFIVQADANQAKCGIIVKDCKDFDCALHDYIVCAHGIKDGFAIKEITAHAVMRLLLHSEYDHFERGEIEERYCLDLNDGFRPHHVEEWIIGEHDKEEIYARAKKILSRGALTEELDRIFAAEKKPYADGHPVHYMIRVSDPEVMRGMRETLLSALYAQNRIESRRVCEFIIDRPDCLNSEQAETVYAAMAGSAVVLRLDFEETDDSGNYAGNTEWMVEKICEIIKKYRNKTLTIFCLPEENTRLKDNLLGHLGTVTAVELGEEFEYDESSRAYLAQLAEESALTPDDALLSRVEPNKGYKAAELKNFFEEWRSDKLKEEVYPQYRELKTANAFLKDAPAKGSAAEELNKMTGLSEAKKVIRRALDCYKAQKLFAGKGMKNDRPCMHMAFTGSPGTAKTTAARLFARILRDNGVLETGVFLELGRSDLVGRFVGWTAPLIKRKFKEAKGGVLFIDEAYSLVDDRSGSFGDEAINTIVQEMENHRDDVIAIFAGYTEDMKAFLERNPGLSSRIAFHVPFDDYEVDELLSISDRIAEQKGVFLTQGAKDKMSRLYKNARTAKNFGNGRYVRNVIEKAKMAQAQRLLTMDLAHVREEDVKNILDVDIEIPPAETAERRIGFHTAR